MKGILKNNPRANAWITPGGLGYMVVGEPDVTAEEVAAAIEAEEVLESFRAAAQYN